MKKFIAAICAALVCCFVLSGTVTEAKTNVYQRNYTTNYREIWSNGVTKVYMNKARTKLCEKNIKSGKVTVLKKLQADLSDENENYYTIANVVGNKIYLNHMDHFNSDVYVYNKTTKKLKKVKKELLIQDAYGDYMIANGYLPSDQTPYEAWIYKINGDSIKKVKTIGKEISGMRICDGKIYFASYANKNHDLKSMKVYSCDLNGQNKNLLFSRSVDFKYGSVYVTEFNAENIIFAEFDSEADTVVEYVYDIATGEIQEVNE